MPTDFTDGSVHYPGCNCGHDCEYPCWQRAGTAPACEDCRCASFAADPDPDDRADDLARLADLWPVVRDSIPTLPEVYAAASAEAAFTDLEAKFRKGEAEHDRDWLRMSRAQLEAEIVNEWRDLLLYHAMLRARFGGKP